MSLSQEIATPANAAAVSYEVAMMRATAHRTLDMNLRMASVPLPDRKTWLLERSAFLESFLIHYRNVMDFLAPARVRATDVTAGPFVGESRGYRFPGTPIALRGAINSYLAHITTIRGTEDMRWQPGLMIRPMDVVIDGFADRMRNGRQQWFDAAETAAAVPGWKGLRSAPRT